MTRQHCEADVSLRKVEDEVSQAAFDLSTPQGKLIAALMAALAEFERDLLRERVRSGIAAARSRGVMFGRQPGQRVKADRMTPKVLALVAAGRSYRSIGRELDLSKNTVLSIVKRAREEKLLPFRGDGHK